MAAAGLWSNHLNQAGVPIPADAQPSIAAGDPALIQAPAPGDTPGKPLGRPQTPTTTPATTLAKAPPSSSGWQASLGTATRQIQTWVSLPLRQLFPGQFSDPFPDRTRQARLNYAIPARREVLVDLSDRRLILRINRRTIATYPVAIGKAGWETPVGHYKIERLQSDPEWEHPLTKRIFPPGPDNPLGAAWIGFRSDAGVHYGFHGTYDEFLLGEAVSHGCVRMANPDILDLFDRVELGTDVTVRP